MATGSELGLAVHLLPVLGSRTLLLLSSLFSSSPRGITLLAVLEHHILMSKMSCPASIRDLGKSVTDLASTRTFLGRIGLLFDHLLCSHYFNMRAIYLILVATYIARRG